MNEVLFDQYPNFNKENIHIPNGYSSQLEDEAERYNQLLNDRGPVDIQILGIGENGHIGFNEPGTDLHSETHILIDRVRYVQTVVILKVNQMFHNKLFQWD